MKKTKLIKLMVLLGITAMVFIPSIAYAQYGYENPDPVIYTIYLDADAEPSEGGSASGGSVDLEEGESGSISASASAEDGWIFSGWGAPRSCSESGDSLECDVNWDDGDISATAYFEPESIRFYLSVSTSGDGSVRGGNSDYREGDGVSLSASPADGWYLLRWEEGGADAGNSSSLLVTMDDAKDVTAIFEEYQYLDVTVTNYGSVTPGEGTSQHEKGAEVSLSATPDAGYRVVWGGDAVVDPLDENSASVTMDTSKSVSVSFKPVTYTLTLGQSGYGSGSTSADPDQAEYIRGAVVTITAWAEPGSIFVSWDDGSTESSRTITMDNNKSFTAIFRLEAYTFTLNGVDDPGIYYYGDEVSITAENKITENLMFKEWIGDTEHVADVTSASTTIQIFGNASISADYVTIYYYLTIEEATDGTIDPPPGPHSYLTAAMLDVADPAGIPHSAQKVTVTATPDAGYTFTGWSGDLSGTDNPATLIIDSDSMSFGAEFTVVAYTITAQSGYGGSISPSSAEVDHGGSQAFTITPNANYQVADILVDGISVGTPSIYTFNGVTAGHTISVTFELVKHALTVNNGLGSGIYDHEQVVQIIADDKTADGLVFSAWTGDIDNVANVANPTTSIAMLG
ncbi:MAG: hypothetical protein ISS26_07540, partial [Candidatus Omnitrophica bacterium]|nr:hypothetical protein [Candidatus Omnitrophota bacterium]